MPRYKIIGRNRPFIPLILDAQLMSGSFEYTSDYLIDRELDVSSRCSLYLDNEIGASDYNSRVLLKIILLVYSRGMVSSRQVELTCRGFLRQATSSPTSL